MLGLNGPFLKCMISQKLNGAVATTALRHFIQQKATRVSPLSRFTKDVSFNSMFHVTAKQVPRYGLAKAEGCRGMQVKAKQCHILNQVYVRCQMRPLLSEEHVIGWVYGSLLCTVSGTVWISF